MSKETLNGEILSEKLSKLNSSQQSIESLSGLCVSHRKQAKLIVQTWAKLFNASQKEQRVSFLYLANDIMQNSRREGSEFVSEFRKVLPTALKHALNDSNVKKVAFRLIDIWEQRKVFGSRARSLKDEILGKNPPSLSLSSEKNAVPIKIVKRDANAVRIKLAVGAMPEILLTAFQAVQEEHLKEEVALNNCKAAVDSVTKVNVDIDKAITHGDQQGSLLDELQKQESMLQHCVGDFENAEVTRAALTSKLREALLEQESELELVRTQLQVARGLIEQAKHMKKRLMISPPFLTNPAATTNFPTDVTARVVEPNPTLSQPATSFAPIRVSEEDKNKAAAAAVAAKLTASTSCAQMLTSVLSSLVAEEAAAKKDGFTPDSAMYSIKRQKFDNPGSAFDMGPAAYISPLQQKPVTGGPPAPPPPTPAAPISPANQQTNQYVMPYGYNPNTLPPPPPLPQHVTMGLARPASQPPQQPPPATGGYYNLPPGFGFYGQNHQPSPPSVPRQ